MITEREVEEAVNRIEVLALQMKYPKSDYSEDYFHAAVWNALMECHSETYSKEDAYKRGYRHILDFCAYAKRYWNSVFNVEKIMDVIRNKQYTGVYELRNLVICGVATTQVIKPYETLAYYILHCKKMGVETKNIFYG